MSIPVVFIHSGYNDYLKYTILNACNWNKVFLLGDVDPSIKHDNFTFVNFGSLSAGVVDFVGNYEHLNTTPHDYEVFCFVRWHILRNFMHSRKIDISFYCDSDVLLFANIEEEYKKFRNFSMTLLHRTAAIASFISIDAINNFVRLIDTHYKDKNTFAFNRAKAIFKVRQSMGMSGGVCDMTWLEYFHYDHDQGGGPGRVGEMMHIIDGSTYDHNINVADNDYRMRDGIKDVKIIEGIPYVFNEKLQKDIKFNSLHFQGQAKGRIITIYNESNRISA